MTLIFKQFSYNTSSRFLVYTFLQTLHYTENDVTVYINNNIMKGI